MQSETITNTFESLPAVIRLHCIRTGAYAGIIAEHTPMLCKYYPDDRLPEIHSAIIEGALYHDIGKVLISEYLCKKKDMINVYEWKAIKRHPLMSEKIVNDEKDFIGYGYSYKQIVIDAVKYHHENYDGSGYPFGLKGQDIPMAARICAVASAFDNLVSKKTYRNMNSFEQSVEAIINESGKMFDPGVVQSFVDSLDELRNVDYAYKGANRAESYQFLPV